MNLFNICVIDDDNNHNRGWQLQIWPLINYHILSGDNLEGADLIISDNGTIGYINHTQKYNFQGIKCNVLTTSNTEERNIDEILEKARKLRSEIYIVDINLEKFYVGEKIRDLNMGGAEIAGELKFQQTPILKDQKCLIILYSAKSDIKRTMSQMKDLIESENVKYITMDGEESASKLFKDISFWITSLQINLIQNFSHEEILELVELTESITSKTWRSFKSDANKETKSGWSLKSLFPKQVNMILLGLNVEINKSEIIGLLESDFRKLVSKLDDHKNITYIYEQICSLDFTNTGPNGKSEYSGLKTKELNKNLTIQEAIKKEFGLQGDNFTPGKIRNDLNSFFNSKKTNPNHLLEILEPDWKLAHRAMIREFGAYYSHIVHIAQVAILNIIYHQQLDLESNRYPPLKISSSYDDENDSLIFEFQAGRTTPNESFDLKKGTNKFWKEGIQVWITKTDRTEYPLISTTDGNAEIKLNELNDGKLIDILKIVCYLWKSEFHYIHGKTRIEFTWDNQKKQFDLKKLEENDNIDEIRYIIKCKKIK